MKNGEDGPGAVCKIVGIILATQASIRLFHLLLTMMLRIPEDLASEAVQNADLGLSGLSPADEMPHAVHQGLGLFAVKKMDRLERFL